MAITAQHKTVAEISITAKSAFSNVMELIFAWIELGAALLAMAFAAHPCLQFRCF